MTSARACYRRFNFDPDAKISLTQASGLEIDMGQSSFGIWVNPRLAATINMTLSKVNRGFS